MWDVYVRIVIVTYSVPENSFCFLTFFLPPICILHSSLHHERLEKSPSNYCFWFLVVPVPVSNWLVKMDDWNFRSLLTFALVHLGSTVCVCFIVTPMVQSNSLSWLYNLKRFPLVMNRYKLDTHLPPSSQSLSSIFFRQSSHGNIENVGKLDWNPPADTSN